MAVYPGGLPAQVNRTTSYPFSPAGTPGGMIGYPPFNLPPGPQFNGGHHQTRRHEPPSSLHPQLSTQTSSSSVDTQSPGPIKGLTREEQIEQMAASFRRRNKKIGVFYDRVQKTRADNIVRRLNDLLSGGVCIIQGFEILPQTSNWLQIALSGGVDFFIFVGLPPKPQQQYPPHYPLTNQITEADFFDVKKYVQRVAEVVVVFPLRGQGESGRYSRSPHYLDNFLRLESDNMDKVAEDALALFAAPRPKPFATDNAFFSEIPKLVSIPKKPGKSLGLSIMTREMSPDSEFPRIVLIKSFGNECMDDVKRKLGRYTHIQSYNGVLLDGMDIKAVTDVFQSMKSSMAYLTIRFIHPVQSVTPTQPAPPPIKKPEAPRLNPIVGEELPIPLYILGYIHGHCKKLFDLLREQEAHSPVSNSSSSSVAAATPNSDLSRQLSFPADPPQLGVDSSQEEVSDFVPGLDTVAKGMSNSKRARIRSLAQSDESFIRAFTSEKLFDDLPPLTFARTPSYPGNGGPHPMSISRQGSRGHAPQTGKKRYILHLPRQKLDESFTHIFFRRSGIYLITVGLMEMMGDPLLQFENLCYWLRQVQTYVGPENVKRIIIVGVHDASPNDYARQLKVEKFTSRLEKAIREADFKQIMEISREKLIITYNLNTPEESTKLLCQCIDNCMNVMIERVWYYEQSSGFYEQTFQPFTQLSSVAGKVSGMKAIVASTADIEDCYNYSDRNYKETLANYCLACINPEGEYHLIRPAFLIELLLSMEMNSHNYMIHATNITALKKLPVVNAPFPKTQMETLVAQRRKEFRQLLPNEGDAILDWADNLEVMYSLSKVKGHMLYFVPFLATEAMGEQANFDWDEEEAKRFQGPDMTVLYAEMHIPASYQLFYGLIAELLKDVVTEHNVQMGRCCINRGCKEAILPLHYIDEKLHSRVFRVYLRYHPLQNIIEFRAKIVKQQLAFLKTVENKLKGALGNSKSYSGSGENFNSAVSFALPASSHSQKLIDSALWTLGEPFQCTREDGELDEEDFDDFDDMRGELLKIKLMTIENQRQWASSAPEMKEIPPEKFLRWSKILGGSDKWALVGSKLGLVTTDDIRFYTHNPHKGGNGVLILDLWRNSDCSYKELVDVLRSEDVHLDTLAAQIEAHFSEV